MNLTNSNLFLGALWALADTLVIIGGGFRIYSVITRRLDRIEYALYNDGKTGLINKVDLLVENQQGIKDDVLVLKVQHQHKPTRSRAKK